MVFFTFLISQLAYLKEELSEDCPFSHSLYFFDQEKHISLDFQCYQCVYTRQDIFKSAFTTYAAVTKCFSEQFTKVIHWTTFTVVQS